MAFRAEEAAAANFENAYRYLVPQGSTQVMRSKIREKLEEIVEECGPVVDGYPGWHPFLLERDKANWAPSVPSYTPSFKFLDHTIYFRNGILTCPYDHGVDEFIEGIKRLKHRDAYISIEKIKDIVLYHENAVPLLIKCHWHISDDMEEDGTIPAKAAIGLMLESEVPNWRHAVYCESWEDMRGQVLGYPHGARSSLFVNQQTGQKMKSLWNQLIKTGVLGKDR